MSFSSAVTPNPSLERTVNGMAPWPRGAVVHVAPRGQGAMPSSAAQLKRQKPVVLPRLLNWVLGVAGVVISVPVAALVLLIAFAPGASGDEVARVAAPGGSFDAVLIETNGGATTSFGYEVYVVPTGTKKMVVPRVAFLYGALRNSSAYGATLRWESPSQLHIEFMQAKSAELKQPVLSVSGQTITEPPRILRRLLRLRMEPK